MNISLKLLATYRSKLPEGISGSEIEIIIGEGNCARDVLDEYGIPLGQASVILINGQPAEPDQQLLEGDVLCAFPAMAGG